MPSAAPDASQKRLTFKQIPLDRLPVGYRLGSPIQDQQGRLLLGPGMVITEDLLHRLRERDIGRVSIDKRDWEGVIRSGRAGNDGGRSAPSLQDPRHERTAATDELDVLLDAQIGCDIEVANDPFAHTVTQHGAAPYSTELSQQHAEHHQQTVGRVGEILQQLGGAEPVSGEQLRQLSHESIVRAAEDLDLFVSLGINDPRRASLFEHSADVARLAIAVGCQLGLDARQLVELGAGCLVHDAGMLGVDEKIRSSSAQLTRDDFLQIARHPILAADMLRESMGSVPLGVRMVVYQMHERCDGSGYPRGFRGDKIHALAKIAAVADTYVAITSPRPHRPAKPPHEAIRTLLEGAAAGLFERRVVRALLEAVSLFPIGSLVELSDGGVGKVLRANGAAYDQPIIEYLTSQSVHEASRIVDLSTAAVRVTGTIDSDGQTPADG